MASRLSEESVKAVHEAGLGGLAVVSDPALDKGATPGVDLEALLLADNPAEAVQAVAPQAMYQSLVRRGPEDALEILPLLSEDQVTRLFDYDTWSGDRLAPLKAVRWLDLFKEVGNEELVRRFRELDEEYQVALLGPFVEMYDEEQYEKMSQEEQDQLHRMPCNTVFYKIKSDDPRITEFITGLLETITTVDINYAYAVLAHSSFMPPNESEAEEARFRKARLEEDGFVTFEESLGAFRRVDLDAVRRRWNFELNRDQAVVAKDGADPRPFLSRVLSDGEPFVPEVAGRITQGLAFLGNMLASAVRVEPDDLSGIRSLMQQARALVSLGLDYLAAGDLAVGREILAAEHPQMLFRAGLTLVARLADATLGVLSDHHLPGASKVFEAFTVDKRGVAISHLGRELGPVLGFERAETLKGLIGRLPVRPHTFHPDVDGAERVEFQPLASMAGLKALAGTLDGITGLVHLAALADDDRLVATSLDQRLTTALARVLLGGEFRADPVTEAELKRLAELPQEGVQTLIADFFAGVEGTLRMNLLPTAEAPGWAASRVAGVPSNDPAQAVLAELSDLVFGLMAARQTPGALRTLLLMRDHA